ncbi:hypothetical protein SeLEV6574_g03526 [Synchytrium endobioticum]|uniref:Transcription initiation protein SPT3 n=1 Tax=Synchytrium endobioticum TaxID=286115 RepID=A0A507D409_9FUNG|nr:hypothetical protein SeLEV6574_g03526 [Synchytrium endobioticum]
MRPLSSSQSRSIAISKRPLADTLRHPIPDPTEIEQMMFIFGEVPEPLDATVQLIEDIVQHQICELVLHAGNLAQKRGAPFMTAEDLIFLIRRDVSKIHRLKAYLTWTHVRTNTADWDVAGELPGFEDLIEENAQDAASVCAVKSTGARVRFSWDPLSAFHSLIGDDEQDDDHEDRHNPHPAYIARLRVEDEITKAMTLEEYKRWTEFRGASFTYKRSNKFREWANLSSLYDSKAHPDFVDVLGFLAYDMVRKLTETALRIKTEWDSSSRKKMSSHHTNSIPPGLDNASAPEYTDEEDDEFQSFLASLNSVFGKSMSERTPLQPMHIHASFRESQLRIRPLRNFKGGMARIPEAFI